MVRTLLVLAAALTFGQAPPPASGRGPPPPPPACVASRAEVRVAYPGYDHWVILDNHCEREQTCVVTTDVSPDPIAVDVAARAQVEVLTFRSSPASTFQHKAVCRPKG
jgi:hypothetical protein